MKKVTITIAALYLLGVIGVMIGALATNWNADWPLLRQLGDAAKAGLVWPLTVADLLAPN